jgi:hypothetical protein
MSSSPFKNLLLPTVLVSGTVFSALLITFVAHQPPPEAIDEAASEMGRTQYVSPKERRESTIRYVGFSVMVSVGVGIATVEGLRKWRSFWESPQDKAKQFGLEQFLQEDFELAPPELELAIEEAPVQFSDSTERSLRVTHKGALTPDADAEIEAENSEESILQFSFSEAFQLQGLANSITASVPEQVLEQPFLNGSENNADHSEVPQVFSQSAAQEPLTLQVLDLHQHPETCRIKVPHSQQVRFASLFEGRYYCFVKAERTKDQALKTAMLLAEAGDQPIITLIKQGYAVWTWEPQAIVEPIA